MSETCDGELPGMWEAADFEGGREVVRPSAADLLQQVVAQHQWVHNPAVPDLLADDGGLLAEGHSAYRICTCHRRFCDTRRLFDRVGM